MHAPRGGSVMIHIGLAVGCKKGWWSHTSTTSPLEKPRDDSILFSKHYSLASSTASFNRFHPNDAGSPVRSIKQPMLPVPHTGRTPFPGR